MEKSWITEEIFFTADLFFANLEQSLLNATTSIELETYIFENDALGQRIASLLRAAAARGVRVRVMVDGFGSPHWAQHFVPDLIKAGAEARVYHPMPLTVLSPYFERHPTLEKFFKRISTMNERNHRKVCIIDRHKAWTGGMNISASHQHWRDTGVFIEGSQVRSLLQAFGDTWNKSWSRRGMLYPRKRWNKITKWISLKLVRLNSTYKSRRQAYHELLIKIDTAKNRVWITNAYFVPPKRLRQSLKEASRRGVDVRVLVPRESDVFFIPWVSSALYCGLLEANVKIFEYLPTPLHAKTLIIDEWATVGTTNLNHRSLIHDLEVDVVLTTSESILTLARQFAEDLKVSQEISFDDWQKRSWPEHIAGRTLLLFRYWI